MFASYLWSTVLIKFLFDIHGQHLASKRKTFSLFNHLLIGWDCIVTHYHMTLKWNRNYSSKVNDWSVSVNCGHHAMPHACCTPIHCTETGIIHPARKTGGTVAFKQMSPNYFLVGHTVPKTGWHRTGKHPVRGTAPILVLLLHFEKVFCYFAQDGLELAILLPQNPK